MPHAFKEYPSLSQLREILDYDAATGEFTWLVSPCSRVPAGARAGRLNVRSGYREIKIGGKYFQCHRLAWIFVHGELPPGLLDHRNLNKTDNRIRNLRPATGSQQNANQAVRPWTKTGVKGVAWHKQSQKWQAQIKRQGKNHYLGLFETKEEAKAAYRGAAIVLFGEFARS